jgi:EAL domain-containing protein (putative c-di-GMP-specific phosphodiesterase class I)
VECQEVADWLAEAGCDHAQGYLWRRPSAWPEIAQTSFARNDLAGHTANDEVQV